MHVRVQLVQVVQVVSTVTASEHVDFLLVGVSRVHVAGAWWLSVRLVVQPAQIVEI